jgi:glycosyltransferase involved in cell wall biosynthesis
MKILVLSLRVPENGKKGDQVLSFHRLSYLSRHHTIKLICFGSATLDAVAIAKLEALGISIQLIHWSNFIAGINLLVAMFNSQLPFQCALYESRQYKRAVTQSFAEFKPEILYVVMIRALINLPSTSLPIFLDMVDSMGLNFSRRVALEQGLKKIALNIECNRISNFEVIAAQQATLSFVVSKVDQLFIGLNKVKVLPIGINELEFYKRSCRNLDPLIIFSGNMNYKPNVDAVLWFYKHCWVKLKIALPTLQWVIAGSNPMNKVLSLRFVDGITVTGRLPSLASVINTAWLSIAPMQSGSGMQFKILESMACGVPVVTTSLGLGDIAAKINQDVIVADTPEVFIQSILKLLRNQKLCSKIGDAGLCYVKSNQTWDALNEEFEKSIFTVLRQ